MSAGKERISRWREKMRSEGLTRVEVIVPGEDRDALLRIAVKMRLRKSASRMTSFHDRQQKYSFLAAREVALMIIDEPDIIKTAEDYVYRHMFTDPAQRDYALKWLSILKKKPEDIAFLLVDNSHESQILRDTRPVFRALDHATRQRLLLEARSFRNDQPATPADFGIGGKPQ